MTKSTKNAQGVATRKRLVKVAEKLFAEQGVGTVSVRAINTAAGQGPAAVHYHFNSKEALLEAVLMDLGQQVSDALADGANTMAEHHDAPTVADLIAMMLDTYFDLLAREPVRGPRWMNIMSQVVNANDPLLWRVAEPSNNAVLTQVVRAFPGLDPDRVKVRWNLMATSALAILSGVGVRTAEAENAGIDFRDELVDFAIGAVERMRST